MKLHMALLVAVSLPLLSAGCASSMDAADDVVDGEEVERDSADLAASPADVAPVEASAPEAEDTSTNGSVCRSATTVVSAVRDVYAVLVPEVVDGYVVIDRDILCAYDHVRFTVTADGSDYEFFGYMSDSRFQVRAAVCPCCGEAGLGHGGPSLSCRSCDTTFSLVGNDDEDEGCAFPSGEVPYEEGEQRVGMLLDDLVEAYERTAAGEAELFEPEPEPVENEADDTSWPRCCRR